MGENEETEKNGEETTPDNGATNLRPPRKITKPERQTQTWKQLDPKPLRTKGPKQQTSKHAGKVTWLIRGEIPKNGNSPEKASASSGVTPSDPQTTTTTTETSKEDQTKENQTKGNQTKTTEKPKVIKGQTDEVFKKPTTRRETTNQKTTPMSETEEEQTTDSDMDTAPNNKREREQATAKSPGKNKNKKKRQAYVSQAKLRNPFYSDSN